MATRQTHVLVTADALWPGHVITYGDRDWTVIAASGARWGDTITLVLSAVDRISDTFNLVAKPHNTLSRRISD